MANGKRVRAAWGHSERCVNSSVYEWMYVCICWSLLPDHSSMSICSNRDSLKDVNRVLGSHVTMKVTHLHTAYGQSLPGSGHFPLPASAVWTRRQLKQMFFLIFSLYLQWMGKWFGASLKWLWCWSKFIFQSAFVNITTVTVATTEDRKFYQLLWS